MQDGHSQGSEGPAANYVRALRRELGISQAEFGLKIGRTQRAASRLETGETDLSLSDFVSMCRRLGRSPAVEFGKVLALMDDASPADTVPSSTAD